MKYLTNKDIQTRFEFFKIIVAIIISLLITLLLICIVSEQPIYAIQQFITGPISSIRRIGNVLEGMTPIMFTGTAVAIMYQAKQFNLSSEGIFYICSAVAAYISINFKLPFIAHPLVGIIISGLVGSFFAVIPAILKIKFKANEVVSSIMLNYILLYLGIYILIYILKDAKAGFNASYKYQSTSVIPKIIVGTRVHLGFIIAIIVIILAYVFLYKTKYGYAIRLTGENINFAKYSGISVVSVILYSQLIGGFIAGIGGAIEQYGFYDRFSWDILPGYGWDGILVSVLAKNNPIFIILSSLFLSYIRVGADVMHRTTDVPTEFIYIIQAVIIVLVASSLFLSKLKHKFIVKNSQKLTD